MAYVISCGRHNMDRYELELELELELEFMLLAYDMLLLFMGVFYDKIKPLFSQVESRRPINNPIAGRCY